MNTAPPQQPLEPALSETVKAYLEPDRARSLLEPLVLANRMESTVDRLANGPPARRDISGAPASGDHPRAAPASIEKTVDTFGSGTLPEPARPASWRRSAVLALATCTALSLGVAVVAAHARRTTDASPAWPVSPVSPSSSAISRADQAPTNVAPSEAEPHIPATLQPSAISAADCPPDAADATSAAAHRQPPRTPIIRTDPLADALPDAPQSPRTRAPAVTASAKAPASKAAAPIDSEFKTAF